MGFHTPTDETITDKRIDLTFALGGVKEFQQIQFSAYSDEMEDIYHPSAILVEYQDADGVWQQSFEGNMPLFDTAKGDFVFVVPDGGSIAAQAVRLTFTACLLYTSIPYTTALPSDAYHESYTDPDHLRLTDGKKSEAWGQANSVGIYSNGANQYFELTFALEKTIQFKQIDIGVLSEPKSGISLPSQIVRCV